MNKIIKIVLILVSTITINTYSQNRKVNEPCNDIMSCENGLFCVETVNGKKCATCDQSTLNSMTGEVSNYCKAFRDGWTPGSSSEYNEALSTDKRVPVGVYDVMIDKAKQCKVARENRESKCWNGGDPEHKKEISSVEASIKTMVDHKYTMIGDKRVFYCSKSTYESKLSTFNSKCNLDFPDIGRKLDAINYELNNGRKVTCRDIEDNSNYCERCWESANALLSEGFQGSNDKFPSDYWKAMSKANENFKKAKEILKTAKDKNLCN